ncbi:MAG: protoporphyrinogen oxidase, partial [Pyrinomonadaceae bacterium]
AGDPKILSIRHAFPKLYKFEKDHGSILQGALFSRKNAADKLSKGTPRSITFKNGMQTLTDALRDELGDRIRVNTPVESLRKSVDFGFEITTGSVTESFDAAIICTPASAAARLIESLDNGLAGELNKIVYPPLAVVVTAFKQMDVAVDPDGFGFLVPGVERRPILGCLWTSSVFENRAPDGYHLFTTFIGGARRAELVQNSDEELVKLAVDELKHNLGVKSDPVFVNVKKWDSAIPQYNLGYETVVDAIETFTEQNRGIFFCSNFYRGISVSDCVKNSIATSADVRASLNRQ